MDVHDQRRQLVLGARVARVGGRVEERMGGQPALGRKLDRPRQREVRGVDGHLCARADDPVRARLDVEANDLRRNGRRAADEERRRPLDRDVDRGHGVVREVEIAQIARLRIEDGEGRPATTVVCAQDAAVLEETERGHAEDPGGIPELGLRRGTIGPNQYGPDPLASR